MADGAEQQGAPNGAPTTVLAAPAAIPGAQPQQVAPVVPQAPESDGPGSVENLRDKNDRVEMPFRDFRRRVGKESRKETRASLRELGTDWGMEFPAKATRDEMLAALKTRIKRYGELEKAEEERKAMEQSAQQKYEQDVKAAEHRARKAERRERRAVAKVRVKRWDQRLRAMASAVVHHDHVDDVLKLLKAEVRSSSKAAKRLDPKRGHGEDRLKQWFVDKVKAVPTYAKLPVVEVGGAPQGGQPQGGGQPTQQHQPAPQQVIPNNGIAPENQNTRPPGAVVVSNLLDQMFPGKTVKHGQANSMTSDEIRRYQDAVIRQRA